MNQFATYLQQHLDGEVLTGDDIRDYFATDASVFRVRPQIVIFPRHEVDIRKVFLWCDQFANKGLVMPVTARGGGSDLAGAAVGSGIVLVLSAHLNQLLEYESKRGYFRLQAGCELGHWQHFLTSQYRFFPPAKNASPVATIGGAVANNSGSHYSEKYGLTGRYVRRLRVVLSNGEIITASRLTRRQTLKKINQSSLEGEIYRQLIRLWPRYQGLLPTWPDNHHIGYDLRNLRSPDGGYNLIPLFVGSQGTLGIVTEIEIATKPYNPVPLMAIMACSNFKDMIALVSEIKKTAPASIEMIDGAALKRIKQMVAGFFDDYPFAVADTAAVLLLEFDNYRHRQAWRRLRRAMKAARYYDVSCQVMSSDRQQQQFERLRDGPSFILADTSRGTRPLPGIEDVHVPLEQMVDFYEAAAELFKKNRLGFMSWGNIGLGQIRVWPKINLQETTGQNRYMKLVDAYFKLVADHGGQTNCFHNDGRLRGPYLNDGLGSEIYEIEREIKDIFDPFAILNPDIKFGASRARNLATLKPKHDWGRFYHKLPRV